LIYGEKNEVNCFHAAALSCDGTTIITSHEDRLLRSYILPHDLLSSHTEDENPRHLKAYSTSNHATQSSAIFTIHPNYNLSDSSSTLLLHGRKDLPLRLTNSLDLNYTHATYSWINPNTEEYLTPSSLIFSSNGNNFISGGKEIIALFDINRYGATDVPIRQWKTRKGRGARKAYGSDGMDIYGLITAMDICKSTGLLAVGSTGGQIGIYDSRKCEGLITRFEVGDRCVNNGKKDVKKDDKNDHKRVETSGSGIMQVAWNSNGRYLFIGERQSDCIEVWDMVNGQRLNRLIGRKAESTQRMNFKVEEIDGKCNVWTGGTDGKLRIWFDVTTFVGDVKPRVEFIAHNDALSNVMIHDSAPVFITTSGSRRTAHDDQYMVDRDTSQVEMKVWLDGAQSQ